MEIAFPSKIWFTTVRLQVIFSPYGMCYKSGTTLKDEKSSLIKRKLLPTNHESKCNTYIAVEISVQTYAKWNKYNVSF